MPVLRKKQTAFVKDIGKLIAHADKIGIELTVGEAHRTLSQQLLYYFGNSLYHAGRGSLKLIKADKRSWTMKSKHLDRLAMDFNFFIDGLYINKAGNEKVALLGKYWESLSNENEWGGHWKHIDEPHFQRNI